MGCAQCVKQCGGRVHFTQLLTKFDLEQSSSIRSDRKRLLVRRSGFQIPEDGGRPAVVCV
jgi:hypothetical protein